MKTTKTNHPANTQHTGTAGGRQQTGQTSKTDTRYRRERGRQRRRWRSRDTQIQNIIGLNWTAQDLFKQEVAAQSYDEDMSKRVREREREG